MRLGDIDGVRGTNRGWKGEFPLGGWRWSRSRTRGSQWGLGAEAESGIMRGARRLVWLESRGVKAGEGGSGLLS